MTIKENNICLKCGKIHTKCTAHKKRRNTPDGNFHPCMKFPRKGEKVCDVHGGNSPKGKASPHYKTGKHSKYSSANATKRFNELFESTGNVELLDIKKEIKTVRVRISFLEERLETGDSLQSWKDVEMAHKALETASTDEERARALKILRDAVKQGKNDYRSWEELIKMQTHLNNLITSARKRMIKDTVRNTSLLITEFLAQLETQENELRNQ